MPAIEELLDRLESVPDIVRGTPADDARLAAIEKELGVKLPDNYAAFLRRFGFALWDGGCVNGYYEMDLENLPGYDFDVVHNTLEQRRAKVPKGVTPLPKDGLVLDDDQAGGYFRPDVGVVAEGRRRRRLLQLRRRRRPRRDLADVRRLPRRTPAQTQARQAKVVSPEPGETPNGGADLAAP